MADTLDDTAVAERLFAMAASCSAVRSTVRPVARVKRSRKSVAQVPGARLVLRKGGGRTKLLTDKSTPARTASPGFLPCVAAIPQLVNRCTVRYGVLVLGEAGCGGVTGGSRTCVGVHCRVAIVCARRRTAPVQSAPGPFRIRGRPRAPTRGQAG